MGSNDPDLSPAEQRVISEKLDQLIQFRRQATHYLEAAYGTEVWYMAPEQIQNVLERWIWAVSKGLPDLAEEYMTTIEEMAKKRRN
jgi:hypothetical protein